METSYKKNLKGDLIIMKRKCILLLTFLILVIFLSGCTGGVVTPLTDE